ncbi:MAG: glycosyl transferase, partial [Candidatus Omnitrophica bacterium]|nr:glycosyl transferase [Candidatus Omnitrophota bacterium]
MFSEGTKENAAVFCHAATFHLAGEAVAGRGDKLYKGMKKLMPNAQKDYNLYKTEPYVYAEYLVGPEHPYLYGEGAFTWITGAAGWQFMAATEWLLGVRHDYEGLRIDPCIPKHWKKVRIKRPFRGAVYDITIENPYAKEKGVKQVLVDNKPITGNLIYPHSDGKAHKVKVLMG